MNYVSEKMKEMQYEAGEEAAYEEAPHRDDEVLSSRVETVGGVRYHYDQFGELVGVMPQKEM